MTTRELLAWLIGVATGAMAVFIVWAYTPWLERLVEAMAR